MELFINEIIRNKALQLLFFITILFYPIDSSASKKIDVTDISYWSYPEYTRVVISLTDNAEFTKNHLSDPDRLYFDIKNSRIKQDFQKSISISNEMLKSVRAGQFNESTVRVVLDLEKITDYKIMTFEDPVRIIIDVFGKATISAKKRIVIDPGHGGHDPGAVGPKKLYEKDVVLDIALKLKEILSEDPNCEVFITRNKDIFLTLVERTAIANSKNADLFVSIHANASPSRTVKGIETYFLNWTNDEEWMKVAARENKISLKKLKKLQKEQSEIEIMKSDLAMENKRDESIKLANYIQKTIVSALNKDYTHIVDNGVKWAPFYVLFGAKMPSVLVEVSFISNPLEERLLSKDEYKKELAQSIASGVAKYLSAIPEVQKIAGIGKTIAP